MYRDAIRFRFDGHEVTVATTKTSTQYRRASEFAPGIGANLDAIANKDVLLVHYSIDERPLARRKDNEGPETPRQTEQATILMLEVAEDIEKPDETKMYHAWSDDLASKIAQIPNENLPLIIKFYKARTGAGFNVWSFE